MRITNPKALEPKDFTSTMYSQKKKKKGVYSKTKDKSFQKKKMKVEQNGFCKFIGETIAGVKLRQLK